MPRLARIVIHPIKSLPGIETESALVLPSGSLQHDRQLALFDDLGRVVNGKRTALVHPIRLSFNAKLEKIELSAGDLSGSTNFLIPRDLHRLETWFTSYFGFPVRVMEDRQNGFPDDLNAPGPTVITTPTFEAITRWFPTLSLQELRLRFRANLEIDDVDEPFWEDRLCAEAGQIVRFRVGNVLFDGINPCQRCVVPTRHSSSGDVYENFQSIFASRRKETLPHWATSSRFNHFYRLSVNTRLAPGELSREIRVGDKVEITGLQAV